MSEWKEERIFVRRQQRFFIYSASHANHFVIVVTHVAKYEYLFANEV